MSIEIPERSEMLRSTAITVTISAICIAIGIAFWAWSGSELDSPVKALNDFNPYITLIIEILLMFGTFVFATVTIINLKLYISKIRAGWTEVIAMVFLMGAISWLMFESWVGMASIVLMVGFVVYLYLLQE